MNTKEQAWSELRHNASGHKENILQEDLTDLGGAGTCSEGPTGLFALADSFLIKEKHFFFTSSLIESQVARLIIT